MNYLIDSDLVKISFKILFNLFQIYKIYIIEVKNLMNILGRLEAIF